MADGEGDEQVVSLDEYLEAEKDLEEDAQAVLGGSDVNNCTYDQVNEQKRHLIRSQSLLYTVTICSLYWLLQADLYQ